MEPETIKSVVLLLVRWSLKFVGGWLAISGISEAAYVEVVAGVLAFAVGALISLIMRKKDLATPPPGL